MTFDTLTIIICAALAMLGILDIIASPLIRRPKSQQNNDNAADSDDNTLPSVSIVLAVHDGEVETERNLPLLLSQDYQGEYEVIVVDESSTDETAEVLKRLKNNHKNLYVTFIPDSSHYVSRRKLALTIGVKAARHEWILFTDADCHPADNQWLKAMAQHCSHDTELVLGATRYDVNATDYERVERIICWWRNAYEAQKRDVYAYQGHNMMFRRKRFKEGNGFLGLKVLYNFLACADALGLAGLDLSAQLQCVQDGVRHTGLLCLGAAHGVMGVCSHVAALAHDESAHLVGISRGVCFFHDHGVAVAVGQGHGIQADAVTDEAGHLCLRSCTTHAVTVEVEDIFGGFACVDAQGYEAEED